MAGGAIIFALGRGPVQPADHRRELNPRGLCLMYACIGYSGSDSDSD